MMDRHAKSPSRSSFASQIDAMTLAALVVLLLVAVGTVLKLGSDEALNRIGCGLNGAVNGLLAYPRPCR